jgi:MoaA/NifB/PqqE/SkfB family radical SAM enzyme
VIRHLTIDVVGGCNLRCPSCPVSYGKNPTGLMSEDTLLRILKKFKREGLKSWSTVALLYNWGEPVLHPRIGGLIRICHREGFPVWLSSNLNDIRNIRQALEANPAHLRISLSGATAETYEKTHARGKIDVLLKNIVEVSQIKTKTFVEILFHQYANNKPDEKIIEDLAKKCGLGFQTTVAGFGPLERALEYKEMGETYNLPWLIQPLSLFGGPDTKCGFQQNQLVMNFCGDVMLCCGVYDEKKYGVGNYLTEPFIEIQRKRTTHDFCGKCLKAGGYSYAIGKHLPPSSKSKSSLFEKIKKYRRG